MKTLIISTIVLLSTLAHAEQQFIQCQATPEEYANNRLPAVMLPKMEIKIAHQTAVSVVGQIEPVTTLVHQNYEIRISGYITKPGNRWIKGGTNLLITAELLEKADETGPRKVLDSDVAGSDTVNSPKQLEATQQGAIATRNHLNNSDYLSARERKEEIKKDQLTSVSVSCELVK